MVLVLLGFTGGTCDRYNRLGGGRVAYNAITQPNHVSLHVGVIEISWLNSKVSTPNYCGVFSMDTFALADLFS